jgi:hypothetical protein
VAPPRTRARFAAWVLVALVLVAASGFVLWRVLSAPSGHPSVLDDSRTEVVASGGGTPTIAPSPSPDLAAPPVANTVPAPSPTWTGPGPATAPGAPTALAVIKITMTAIAFGWQPPGNAGTGGIAYYRITLNGADAGWTTDTKVTLGGLNPATTYTIAVRAVNNAGLTSPASGSLTATTSPMPTASSTTVAVPTFSVSPANPIPLGDSFGVTGSGWTCIAPDQIEVLFDGERVATRVADGQGGFTAIVNVHTDQDGTFYANVLGGNTRVKITSGDHMLTVQCAATSKTTTVTFT